MRNYSWWTQKNLEIGYAILPECVLYLHLITVVLYISNNFFGFITGAPSLTISKRILLQQSITLLFFICPLPLWPWKANVTFMGLKKTLERYGNRKMKNVEIRKYGNKKNSEILNWDNSKMQNCKILKTNKN